MVGATDGTRCYLGADHANRLGRVDVPRLLSDRRLAELGCDQQVWLGVVKQAELGAEPRDRILCQLPALHPAAEGRHPGPGLLDQLELIPRMRLIRKTSGVGSVSVLLSEVSAEGAGITDALEGFLCMSTLRCGGEDLLC